METAAIIAIVTQAAKAVIDNYPTIIQTINDLRPFVVQLFHQIKGDAPTTDDQAAIEKMLDELSAQLQEPLPDE